MWFGSQRLMFNKKQGMKPCLLVKIPEMDCLELLAINGITGHDPCRALSASARNSLEPQTDLPVGAVLILTSKCALKNRVFTRFLVKSPGDGFEPPLKEPESFVLPLDDPGIFSL